jgi:enoyl-[acyl-carrier protein] reductase II
MESSAHDNFKTIRDERRRYTVDIKGISSVWLIKNKFYQDLQVLYEKCPTKDELLHFRKSKAKRGCLKVI